MKGAALCLLISLSTGRGVAATEQKHADLDALLAKLLVPTGSTSADSKQALVDRANSDPGAKTYISRQLPAVLESFRGAKDGRENYAWGNAAQLAG